MPRVAKVILVILGMAILILIITLVIGVRLLKKSLPQTTGTVEIQGLRQPVRVIRDHHGLPHIFAENSDDLYFAMGYVVAQDRLWQMDINRRSALGTLSEIYGKSTLSYDRFIHTIGLPSIARNLTESLSPESKKILTSYADGVNAFITTHFDQLPIEFAVLDYEPQAWEVEHSLAYQRLMAWGLEMAWFVDPVYGQLAGKVTPEKLAEISLDESAGKKPRLHQFREHSPIAHQTFQELNDTLNTLAGFFGTGLGSNSWVVSGRKTKTGKPLLANDPHLELKNPGIWYEVHLHAPGMDCHGVSLPGIPGIVIGRNKSLAWGLTNAMADGCDFCIESMNPVNQNQYLYEGRWFETVQEKKEIAVRDTLPETITIRSTKHGPIISDIVPALQDSSHTVSINWAGFIRSDEVLAFSKINRAQNWEQFLDGLRHFAVPAQNFMYADVAGNIGHYCAGKIPIRVKGRGLVPLPGQNGDCEWEGWIPFEQLPHDFNPLNGILHSANNQLGDPLYPYFISSYWEPSYRADRIIERLTQTEIFDADAFQAIQMDLISRHGEFMKPFILKVLPGFEQKDKLTEFFCNTIVSWDFNTDTRSVGATIFEVYLIKLYENIYLDEMGEPLFQSFMRLPNIPIRVTDQLLTQGVSRWFDNVSTPDTVEVMDGILLESLHETYDFLIANFGEKVFDWRWGQIHTITFDHPLGKKAPLNSLFNIGPFPIGGSETTVNNATYRMRGNQFETVVGPSLRQIIDLSHPNKSRWMITTGQTAHPLSRHFKDMAPMWLNGDYLPMMTDSLKICTSDFDNLVLKPDNF
ncbi:MAG: penicillin acylase family protein [Candidatus Zhuqueibacterota bacterium]